MESRAYTYHTRVTISKEQDVFLNDFGCLYGKVERSLHAAFSSGKSILSCKNSYLKKFGITARQFNSVRIMLQGKHRSIQALQGEYIANLIARIKKTQHRIRILTKKKDKTAHKQALFQKKRHLECQKLKHKQLCIDKEQEKIRLCFGSKALFKKQHHLEENDYPNHEAWLEAWQAKRSNQFFLVGSMDETSGNQSVVATLNEAGSLDLRVRVPDALIEKHGKFVIIRDVEFAYGHEPVTKALLDNFTRQALQKASNRKLHGDLYKQHGCAINYRFLHDDKGWRVFVTLERKIKSKSEKRHGSIGVDINANHLAVCEVDATGNYIKCFNVSCCTYGKNQNQAKAIIGDACKAIVSYAQQKNKPIIIEKLDFTKKKQSLSTQSNAKARMLSGFAYAQIKNNLQSKAFRQGIQLYAVNPAYSSIIGRVKFARQYTISIHQSAALVIARRFYGYRERLPKRWDNIPDNTGSRLTLQGLVKNPDGHIWKAWAIIQRQLKPVLVARYQMLAQPPEVGTTRALSSMGNNIPIEDELPF